MIEPRLYQLEATSATWRYWRDEPRGIPLINAPTGSGKSVIIAEICRKLRAGRPTYRIWVVSHRGEIISQNAAEISGLLNEPVGIFSASLGQKIVKPITCANIQSIYKKEVEAQLVIIDECHLVSGKENSMYTKFVENLRKVNPHVKFLGLTATAYRVDQGLLIGDGSFFTEVVYDIDIRRLIDEGFLCTVTSKPGKSAVDLKGIRTSGYDYNKEDLERVFEPSIVQHVDEIISATLERNHILVFASGISHARDVASAFNRAGIPADYVTGDMLPFERNRRLADFKSGKIRVLVNCEILTTGFNFPALDCIVFLRATKSTSLYVQIVGRGMRTCHGKRNCLVLDFGRNIERHGPIDCILVNRKSKDGKAKIGIAPTKECPSCGAITSIRTIFCECGFEFDIATTQEPKPSEAPVLSEPEEFAVESVVYLRGQKEGKPPYVRVKYRFGEYDSASQFLCFEHGGFATRKAEEWWRLAFDGVAYAASEPDSDFWPVPTTTEEALELVKFLKRPVMVRAIKKKWYEILNVEFKEREFKNIEQELEDNPYNL